MIAVAGMFTEISAKRAEILKYYYIATMLAVFFVLRVFSESTASKIVVGAMYYVLTGIVTYLVIGIAMKRKKAEAGQQAIN